jgi:hypothetical protein
MTVHYFDSHGCKITFIVRKDNAAITLKRRKALYVLPEVVEVIDRIESRCGKEVALENVSCELCVHPVVIRGIFRYLQSTGLLGEEEPLPKHMADNCCVLPEMKEGWGGNIYPILRSVREEDYGKKAEPQKEDNNKSQTA